MPIIPDETVQKIKNSVNIVEVIDQFVALKKRGKNHFGFCPFHDERTPSFSVSEEKQIYKCFSCGRAGNVFSFFMEKDGLSFVESVEEVAKIGDVPLAIDLSNQAHASEKSPKQLEIQNIMAMHQMAVDIYHHILLHTVEGEPALMYLEKRGFTRETIETFKIGVSLSQRHLLTNQLKKQGYTDEQLIQSGLVSQYQDTILDRFSNRIMFPLRNEKGEYVAFSGRVYLEQPVDSTSDFKEPKYLNSPETSAFNKGSFLFNLDLARPTIRKTSEFMLCEGFMDVLATWQAGITNGVASMGTSLTEQQIHQLKRLGNKVIIAYDGDKAGQAATDRAIQLLRKVGGFTISVVPMLDNMDPDEMIQTKGAAYFLEHVNYHQETDFVFYKRFYRHHDTLDAQKNQLEYVDALLKELLYVSSVTARSMYIKELSDEFNISQTALEEQLRLFYNEKQKQQQKISYAKQLNPLEMTPPVVTLSKRQKAEEQLLKRLLTQKQAQPILEQLSKEIEFSTVLDQELYLLLRGFRRTAVTATDYDWLDFFQDNLALRNRVAELVAREFDEQMSEQEIIDLITVLDKDDWRKQYDAKKVELNEAEKAKDEARVVQLLLELQKLVKKIK